MTHLSSLPAPGAGLFVRFAYWMSRRRFGKVPAPVGVMAHHTTVLAAVAAFEMTLERAHDLDPHLRELANVKAASLVGCRFCIDLGGAMAQRGGVSAAKLLALPFHETSPEFSPRERRVLDYVTQMTATPSQSDPELFRALQEDLGIPALVELTAVIAWENFRARFNHAVGAREEGYSENMVCLLPDSTPAKEPLQAGTHAKEPLHA